MFAKARTSDLVYPCEKESAISLLTIPQMLTNQSSQTAGRKRQSKAKHFVMGMGGKLPDNGKRIHQYDLKSTSDRDHASIHLFSAFHVEGAAEDEEETAVVLDTVPQKIRKLSKYRKETLRFTTCSRRESDLRHFDQCLLALQGSSHSAKWTRVFITKATATLRNAAPSTDFNRKQQTNHPKGAYASRPRLSKPLVSTWFAKSFHCFYGDWENSINGVPTTNTTVTKLREGPVYIHDINMQCGQSSAGGMTDEVSEQKRIQFTGWQTPVPPTELSP
ncbi:hypothetical protein STEG23_032350, partial [Scotinomys teguina]